jgi:hypothetical protein
VLVDRDFLQRLALNARNNATHKPARLAHLQDTDTMLYILSLRRRVGEARKLKAKRGELFGTIAVGYRKVAHEDRIEKEPDQRVQQAIKLVFKKFADFQSARQVHRWLRQEGIALPNMSACAMVKSAIGQTSATAGSAPR